MHLSTFLTLAVTSSVAVLPASARLDRRSASHRDIARAQHSKRTPTPEPFRVFGADGAPAAAPQVFEGVVALKKRDGASDVLGKIGDVVNDVAVAWKLALPTQNAEPVALAAAAKSQEEQEKAAAAKKAAAEKATAEKKAAEELAAKKKAQAAERKRKAAIRAAKKQAAEEAAAKKKAAAEAKAAQEKAAAEAAAKKAAEEKAAAEAAKKAAAEKAAAEAAAKKAAEEKAAEEKAAAEQKAQEEAAAKKAAEEKKAAEAAAAKEAAAAEKKKQEEAEQKKVYDSSSESQSKLAVFKPGNSRSLIGYSAGNCGASGANDEFPNGSLDWLNCGISKNDPSRGWTPPDGVTLERITTVSLEHALATNHVWEPCRDLVWLFDKVAAETGLPAILLASFALQESTCNPKTIGGGGEVGLMQITPDKCGGRSQSACADPEFNLRTAANYFKQELANQGGQFLKALGAYNGWYPGLSYNGATAAAYSGCCRCQNNLDYLFQMTNGWLVGKTGYELKKYNNLAVCD